jgi:8-oxo-dGTP pyrophosphatase MutT (NUDIX family)
LGKGSDPYNQFIRQLKSELKKELPGKAIQYRMAPSERVHDVFPFEKNDLTLTGSVIILIFPKNKKINIVLIQRTTYPGVHSDQISFPGGKSEKGDRDLIDTALRETNEEIGIPVKDIRILGTLTPLFIPVSNIIVYPVVGCISYKPDFKTDKAEVKFLIEPPLNYLLRPDIIEKKIMIIQNTKVRVPYFNFNGKHIWGATAMILSEFLEVIKRNELNRILF